MATDHLRESRTVVTLLRLNDGSDAGRIDHWREKLVDTAVEAPGFAGVAINRPGENDVDWEIRLTFDDAASARQWRDSTAHDRLIDELETLAHDVAERTVAAVVWNELPTMIIHQSVPKVKAEQFDNWQRDLTRVVSRQSGFVSRILVRPALDSESEDGSEQEWQIAVTFESEDTMEQWNQSPDRNELMERGESLYTAAERSTGSAFSGWFGTDSAGRSPAAWKQAMIVLLTLYPVVMVELIWFGGLLDSIGIKNLALNTFVQNIVSVGLLTWPLIPAASWVMARWLHNDDRRQPWLTVRGVLVLLAIYAVMIAFFVLTPL
ncbi:MAG: hypothetical protein ACFB50_14110 [Rubrobacteraceae bacterium]